VPVSGILPLRAEEKYLIGNALSELADDKQVRKVSGFRQAATTLTGSSLAELYRLERESAPDRSAQGERYFLGHEGRLRTVPKVDREEHFAIALVNHCRDLGEGLELPEGGALELLDYQVPLDGGGSDRKVGDADLVGMLPGGRLAVIELKFVKPSATRGATGETPLRALVQALARSAVAAANQAAIGVEVAERFGLEVADAPPAAIVLANARYWELCRKREAQKGAGWISELERLAEEIEEGIGAPVRFLCVKFPGQPDPGWSCPDRKPTLDEEPTLVAAWEASAGRVKPKTPRSARPARMPEIVEADPTRPVRPYAVSEIFAVGDAISHRTLGNGVVQRIVGPTKIEVRFEDERNRVLVHGRPSRSA
jgi:hypothetical protein